MTLEQKPFRKYKETVKLDTFTVRLNKSEREQLNIDKKRLRQQKDSTAIKQLASIGSNVLHDDFTGSIIDTIFKNKRRNQKIGITDIE